MRILAYCDGILRNNPIIPQALERLKQEYEGITNVSWEFQYADFTLLPWIKYDAESYIVPDYAIQQDISKIEKQIAGDYDYDLIIYFIDESHWPIQSVLGWNKGKFFNNYQICLMKVVSNFSLLDHVIRHEIMHSLDNFCVRELGIDISLKVGLTSRQWDRVVVHGNQDPPYPVTVANAYKGYLLKIASILKEMFELRKNKQTLGMLQIIIGLYHKLLYLLKQQDRHGIIK